MPKTQLKQTFVESASTKDKPKVDYFDTDVTGLLLKVLNSGKKSYYLRYQDDRGRQREKRFADASVVTLKEARRKAKDLLAQIGLGHDPFEEKATLKAVPTFGDFVINTYLPFIQGYKRSWETDECLLRNHVLPRLGKLHLDEITRSDMVEVFSQHREGHKPSSTNRVIILCRYIFNCSLNWEVAGITSNPTNKIPLYPENNKRERYLTIVEAKRLYEALEESPSPHLKPIITMLLLTGARRNEVLKARWIDFDLANRQWKIEFNKSGKTRYVPLSDGVLTLLKQLSISRSGPYLFPNPKTGEPFVSIFHSWDTARKKAELPDLRIHDLRHSFASFLINNGRSLYEVQRILGHTQVKTTQRYSHLSQDSLVSAANAAGDALQENFIQPLALAE